MYVTASLIFSYNSLKSPSTKNEDSRGLIHVVFKSLTTRMVSRTTLYFSHLAKERLSNR